MPRPIRSPLAATALAAVALAAALAAHAAPTPRFPANSWWYEDVSAPSRKHPNSDAMIAHLQALGGWGTNDITPPTTDYGRFQIDFAIEVMQAAANAPTKPVSGYPYPPPDTYYSPDCDAPGFAFPLPTGGAIEGTADYTSCNNVPTGDDCHLLVVQGNTLFEAYKAKVVGAGLQSECALRWDLTKVYPRQGRGEQCTSADAAGYPIAALLFNADDVWSAAQSHGDIGHALRFILPNARMSRDYYVHPANHAGGPHDTDPNAMPYGAHLRLRADFPIASFSANESVRAILRTMQKYGIVLADGGNVPLTAQNDTFTTHKWSDADVAIDSHALYGVQVTDFEVVQTGALIAHTNDCVPTPPDFIFIDGNDY